MIIIFLPDSKGSGIKPGTVHQRGPWRTVEQVELATLEWVWAEVEDAYYADLGSASPATAGQGNR
ncbi:hypothetical protein [Microbacterium sp. Root53]|uniref:hypothetical protein n=1 Tax=Microbacterium sp. Root53 TaxID=1736553 RepID=UPI000A8C0D7E